MDRGEEVKTPDKRFKDSSTDSKQSRKWIREGKRCGPTLGKNFCWGERRGIRRKDSAVEKTRLCGPWEGADLKKRAKLKQVMLGDVGESGSDRKKLGTVGDQGGCAIVRGTERDRVWGNLHAVKRMTAGGAEKKGEGGGKVGASDRGTGHP